MLFFYDDRLLISMPFRVFGEDKLYRVAIELILNRDPAISGTLVFGRGKPQVGLIVEPNEAYVFDLSDRSAVDRYIDVIWYDLEATSDLQPNESFHWVHFLNLQLFIYLFLKKRTGHPLKQPTSYLQPIVESLET